MGSGKTNDLSQATLVVDEQRSCLSFLQTLKKTSLQDMLCFMQKGQTTSHPPPWLVLNPGNLLGEPFVSFYNADAWVLLQTLKAEPWGVMSEQHASSVPACRPARWWNGQPWPRTADPGCPCRSQHIFVLSPSFAREIRPPSRFWSINSPLLS